MRFLCYLLLALSVTVTAVAIELRVVLKSEWVRDHEPQHQMMVNGTHPVVTMKGTEVKTCHLCPRDHSLEIELEVMRMDGRHLQTLGDKWRVIYRAAITHTCVLSITEAVCDTEVSTNRGLLTVKRSSKEMFGRGNFLPLLESISTPGLQFLMERREAMMMHWRIPLEKMTDKAQPSNVWMTLIKDSSTGFVKCVAHYTSHFPISVALLSSNGKAFRGKDSWTLGAANSIAESNDLVYERCLVESTVGWSIMITEIPEGNQNTRLFEYDRREERNDWKQESITVKPSPPKHTATETVPVKESPNLWTVLCTTSIVTTVLVLCLTSLIAACRHCVKLRRPNGHRDEEGRLGEYMRF